MRTRLVTRQYCITSTSTKHLVAESREIENVEFSNLYRITKANMDALAEVKNQIDGKKGK
jgi:hypothetical protein